MLYIRLTVSDTDVARRKVGKHDGINRQIITDGNLPFETLPRYRTLNNKLLRKPLMYILCYYL